MKFIRRLTWLHWFLSIAIGFIVSGTAGAAWGYATGTNQREKELVFSIAVDIQTQYQLGLSDYEAGNYPLAKQRFDYVLEHDPNYPGVIDMLTETSLRLAESDIQATAVIYPTLTTAAPTPSPTADTRPLEDVFAAAQIQLQNQEWANLVQTIISLRDIDPVYRVKEIDRMLFLGLRFRGADNILNQGNLEGGLYDLALVERFAPLDSQVRSYREWARLYVLGVSFWGIFPDKSVYYFSQLASAAPYLRDLSGIFAKDRYRMALVQFGDQLSKDGEWCLAFEQYELAQSFVAEDGLKPTLTYAEEQCLYGTAAPTDLEPDLTLTVDTFTATPGPTLTITPFPFTLTRTSSVSLTPTLEVTDTPTLTVETPETSPTLSETPEPSQTPSETPTPTTTETTP